MSISVAIPPTCIIVHNAKQGIMSTQTENIAIAQTKQIISQLLTTWNTNTNRVTAFFNKYEDDFYLQEVAPGRSRAIYLLGHLVASNDGLLSLFGISEKLYPQLEELFLTNPDKAFNEYPSLAELREYWKKVSSTLADHFSKMEPSDWLSRHTKVSEEDFAKEPHRNKLNVLVSRAGHISYHMGQLVFLEKKEPAF